MCLMNIAGSAKFSSDRAVKEYARDIWNVSTERLVLPSKMFGSVDSIGEIVKSPRSSNDKLPLPVWYALRLPLQKLLIHLIITDSTLFMF